MLIPQREAEEMYPVERKGMELHDLRQIIFFSAIFKNSRTQEEIFREVLP